MENDSILKYITYDIAGNRLCFSTEEDMQNYKINQVKIFEMCKPKIDTTNIKKIILYGTKGEF